MLNVYFKYIIIIENMAIVYFVLYSYYILLNNNIKCILNVYYTMIYLFMKTFLTLKKLE